MKLLGDCLSPTSDLSKNGGFGKQICSQPSLTTNSINAKSFRKFPFDESKNARLKQYTMSIQIRNELLRFVSIIEVRDYENNFDLEPDGWLNYFEISQHYKYPNGIRVVAGQV